MFSGIGTALTINNALWKVEVWSFFFETMHITTYYIGDYRAYNLAEQMEEIRCNLSHRRYTLYVLWHIWYTYTNIYKEQNCENNK